MAAQTVCSFFKFGYCKHKEMCRKRHVTEICENSSCEVYTCMLRHPKICKYLRNYGMCKFDPCMFSHKINDTTQKNLEAKLDANCLKIVTLEKIISEKDDVIHQLSLKIDENSEEIQRIVEKIKDLEKFESMNAVLETLEKRIVDKTNALEEKLNSIVKNREETRNNKSNDDKIVAMEKKIYILEKRRLGSDFCEFCDQEFMLGSEKDRKEKQIHIREMHTFECNVCKIKHKNKEELDIHLLTCEIYVCSLCSYTHNRLSEMKSHCKTKHTRNTIIKHCKMDRENFSNLKSTNYFSEEI
jgi:hypothetical protein